MNIESFAIGVLTMIVFAVAILVVLGVLKVVNLTKQVVTLKRRLEDDERELSREIHMVEQTIMNQIRHDSDHIHQEINECHRHTDEVLRSANSYTDSRFDKATGLTGAKEIIKG